MQKYTCKLANLEDAPIYEISYWEMASMSIQYPMLMLHEGSWKQIKHSDDGIFLV